MARWEVRCIYTVEIEAETEDEAVEIAESLVKADTHPSYEYEVECVDNAYYWRRQD